MSKTSEEASDPLDGVVVVHQSGARGCTVAFSDGRVIPAVLDLRSLGETEGCQFGNLLGWSVKVIERTTPMMARIVGMQPPRAETPTSIRAALPEDVGALIALSHRTIDACYRCFLSDENVESFLNSGFLESYPQDHLERCTVILCGGKIAGYSVSKDDLIDLMMIDVQHQRNGLGAKLLGHCELALFAQHEQIRLESFEENEQADRFYRNNGWTEARRFTDEQGLRKIEFYKRRDSH